MDSSVGAIGAPAAVNAPSTTPPSTGRPALGLGGTPRSSDSVSTSGALAPSILGTQAGMGLAHASTGTDQAQAGDANAAMKSGNATGQ